MQKIKVGCAVAALSMLVIGLGQIQSFGQASGGNSVPSGGGGTSSSGTGGGLESAHSGLPPGPGTGGQSSSNGSSGATGGTTGTATNAPGMAPPTGAAPVTSQPVSPHSGGPISPNS